MAAEYDIEGPAPTLEDALQVLEQFLAGQIHQDLMLATLRGVVAEDSATAHRLQEKIDSALRASELSEPVWERITAELDHALSEEAPTEWPEGDATAPQPGGSLDDTGISDALPAPGSAPPVLDDRVATPSPADEVQGADMPPGTLLGDRYVIVSRAHAGGMGDVYKALDRTRKESGDPDPWVAIKVLGKEFANHPQALATLEREAENCRSLDHENVVRVFDFERDGDTGFLTMEWLEGESLVQLLGRARHKPPNATQLRRIILGLGAALAHAHAKGITHADVKPGNVFVTHGGEIKLLDFGAARTATGEYEADVNAKTPAYSSCEVLEGKNPEPGDDVFSYALVIYRLLAGRRAFGKSNALEAEAANLVPERIASLADQAWTALARALEFRRANRPTDVTSFLEAFTAPPRPEGEPATAATSDADTPASATGPHTDEPAAAATAEIPAPGDAPAGEDVDPNAETGIAPVQAPESEASAAGWRRPALIAASVLACTVTAWWLWPAEPDPVPVARSPRTPPARIPAPAEVQPEADELATIVVDARRREELLAIEADFTAANGIAEDATSAGVGEDSLALGAAEPGLEESPKPDAQLASVEAAPAVSPPTRDSGETAKLPSPPAEVIAPPKPVARDRSQPQPEAPSEPVAEPAAEPDTMPEAEAGAAGAIADTTAENEPAAMPALAREITPREPAEPALPAAPGEIASVGPPTPDRNTLILGDYGPAPAPAPVGPPEVVMSELEFSRFVEPRYPRSRTARKTRGWAEVEFQVGPDGETSKVRVSDSSPPELFDEPAIAAVEKWRFKPFIVDGEAIAVSSAVRLRFEPQR